MEALPIMQPPNDGNKTITIGFPDEIPELGDKIANLTLVEAVQLSKYLEHKNVVDYMA